MRTPQPLPTPRVLGTLRRAAMVAFILAVAGCLRPAFDASAPPARLAPDAAAALAGSWIGAVYESRTDPGYPVSLFGEATADGQYTGRLAYTRSTVPPIPVKVVRATSGRVVLMAGPYYNSETDQNMITRIEATRTGERLEGTLYAQAVSGSTFYRGHFTAQRIVAPAPTAPVTAVGSTTDGR